ncbi:MAG: hypothetical protein ACTHJ3_13085, partial [Pararhizobium sp.]
MTESKSQHGDPLFCHSLFRSGSTYMFSLFRKHESGFTCFQEPLHEEVIWSLGDREILLGTTSDNRKALRHPQLDRPYFLELYETYDAWKDVIAKPMVYDDYFGGAEGVDTAAYFAALVKAAPQRAFFQDCRTSSRIGKLKAALGGHHAYLWRNPWDQWWSYKSTDYFEIAQLLALNALNPPEAIEELRRRIGFEPWHDADTRRELEHFYARRPSPEHSYLAYYTLWLSGLIEGQAHADLLVSIDALSTSDDERRRVTDALAEVGVGGFSFADCRIPQSVFSDDERAFFEQIEAQAHAILRETGTSEETIESVLALRRANAPARTAPDGASAPVNELPPAVYRNIIRRVEARENAAVEAARLESNALRKISEELAVKHKEASAAHDSAVAMLNDAYTEMHSRTEVLTNRLSGMNADMNSLSTSLTRVWDEKQALAEQIAQLRREFAEARSERGDLEEQTKELRASLSSMTGDREELLRKTEEFRRQAEEFDIRLRQVYDSRSWRLTKPYRWIGRLLSRLKVRSSPSAADTAARRKPALKHVLL